MHLTICVDYRDNLNSVLHCVISKNSMVYSRKDPLTSTSAMDLNRNIALGKLPKRSLAPVRKPLPREKFRNENLL